jgi:prepilin-type N-terminal cleavage/methylation domain-containing protein
MRSLMASTLPADGRARLCAHAARADGYSLPELVTVMAILGIVVGSLTTIFVSGSNAQLKQSRRLEAQQNARSAVVQLRRELHCASAITATPSVPVASITATLPAACLGQSGAPVSIAYATSLVSTGRYQVVRTQGADARPLADHVTSATPFTYTPPSSTSLGTLRVDLPVDVDTSSSEGTWRLVDDIVLRNTTRS